MRLATFDGDAWDLEDVEVTETADVIHGHWSILFRIDSNDRPHIAYRCSDLQLRYDDDGNPIYDAAGYHRGRVIGMFVHYATKDESGWTVENVGEAAGWNDKFLVTLGFTLSNDRPVIVTGYQDALNGKTLRVKSAEKIDGNWITKSVYDKEDGYYGWFQIGAETDANQNVHISFCAEFSGGGDDAPYPTAGHSLMYGRYDGTAWQVRPPSAPMPQPEAKRDTPRARPSPVSLWETPRTSRWMPTGNRRSCIWAGSRAAAFIPFPSAGSMNGSKRERPSDKIRRRSPERFAGRLVGAGGPCKISTMNNPATKAFPVQTRDTFVAFYLGAARKTGRALRSEERWTERPLSDWATSRRETSAWGVMPWN